MNYQLLHIFRNNPLGRETLLQTIYFCKKINIAPVVYVPDNTKFLMYFDNDVVQVDLDSSYLTAPKTARAHAADLLEKHGLRPNFLTPRHYTASTLPDIPTDFDFMCCPRSISDLSSKIGIGYIGSRVRKIVQSARFPVLIPTSAYKEWKSIAVFFGGSINAFKSLRLGLRIKQASGIPLDVFTQSKHKMKKEDYQKLIQERGLEDLFNQHVRNWRLFTEGNLKENLFEVPHDALAVVGAYGHNIVKDFVFGSTMEVIQSNLPNNLLIVGPNYTVSHPGTP
jgi:hypothetical protein